MHFNLIRSIFMHLIIFIHRSKKMGGKGTKYSMMEILATSQKKNDTEESRFSCDERALLKCNNHLLLVFRATKAYH